MIVIVKITSDIQYYMDSCDIKIDIRTDQKAKNW
jgi:hypothetical protein